MQMIVPQFQWITACLLLPLVSSIQVREPENEVEVAPAVTPATEPPDNGMAVGEAPTEVTSGTLGTPLFQVNEATEFSTIKPAVDAVFPDNHKLNFTGSPYAGTIETPPLLDSFNKYQHAYKEYYAQKNEFINAKPIKFEDNNAKNKYVTATAGLSAYGDEAQAGSDVHLRNKPFPYLYDTGTAQINQQDPQTTGDNNPFDSGVNDAFQDNALPQTHPDMNLFSTAASPLAGLFPYARGPHHHKPKTDVSEGGRKGSWKKTLRFLSTVIPFGIFLATLTPNILQINTVEDNRPSRLRSLDGARSQKEESADPLVQLVSRFGGLEAMEDPVCEDRFFCEMSVLGSKVTSNFVERGFWFLANETPDDMAEQAGMKELFKAIRSNSCHQYDCKPAEVTPQSKQQSTETLHTTEKKEMKPKKVKKFYRT